MTTPPVAYSLHVADEPADAVVHLHLREELSQLYECALVVALEPGAPFPARWLGAPAQLAIHHGAMTRRVLGVVRRVEDLGATAVRQYVRLVVVPSLWLLSQRQDSRVFQNLAVPDIVRAVLRDAGLYDGDRLAVSEALRDLAPREYCVQHRERDLDFVLRILQEEGVALAFEHERDDGETLALVDGTERWLHVATADGAEGVALLDEGTATADAESVHKLDAQGSLRPTGVALRDHDFSRPRAVLDLSPSAGGAGRSLYDYPARLSLQPWDDGGHVYRGHDGARQARIRLEAEQRDALTALGTGIVTGFMPGSAFQLHGHARAELDRRWLLVAVEHVGHAWGDVAEDLSPRGPFASIVRSVGVEVPGLTRDPLPFDRYANRFRCMPAERPFRPARETSRPIVHGAQTATVVGPAGEEIHVDHHGRIKVQFHWDRIGRMDERSSCWVRVSQPWAGAGWGAVVIPRIGMEVVVTFLEGDPDRPLVTGCVYNGQNGVPYPLPDEKTKSTFKTNTSPTNGGYNELRFEDRRGAEEVYLQAERDWNTLVKHDQTLTVQRHRVKRVEGRERNVVVKDRVSTVQQNDSLTVEGNHEAHVQGALGSSVRVDAVLTVVADERMVLRCGDSVIELTPDVLTVQAKTVQVRGDELVNVWAPMVKINTEEAPAVGALTLGGGSDAGAATAQGGGGLQRLWDLLDIDRASGAAGRSFGALLKKIGVPDRIRDRLSGLATRTAKELLTAAKEGRKPAWSKIGEDAVGTVVGAGVAEVFHPLMELKAVKDSPFLTGLLEEAQAATTTAGTWGALYALGLRDGLARDPFWQVMERDHLDRSLRFLADQGWALTDSAIAEWETDNAAPTPAAAPAVADAPAPSPTPAASTARPPITDAMTRGGQRGIENAVYTYGASGMDVQRTGLFGWGEDDEEGSSDDPVIAADRASLEAARAASQGAPACCLAALGEIERQMDQRDAVHARGPSSANNTARGLYRRVADQHGIEHETNGGRDPRPNAFRVAWRAMETQFARNYPPPVQVTNI